MSLREGLVAALVLASCLSLALLGGAKVLASPPAPVPWLDLPCVGMVPPAAGRAEAG